jgi:WD40 repeat protein
MGKVRSFVFIVVAIILVISACSPTAEPTVNDVIPPSAEVDQPAASPTLAAAASTSEKSATQTANPTEIPPTPTATSTPAPPSGTLTLSGEYGYGTGWPFYKKEIQLSADEKNLIVTTSAGIFTFSAEDLSPQVAIHEPFGLYPYYRNIRISRDGTQAVATSYSTMGDLVLRVWDLVTGDLLDEYTFSLDETGEFGSVYEIAVSPDNQQAALLDEKGSILAVNLTDGSVVTKNEDYINNTSTPLWLEYDPDGKYVYYVFRDVSSMGVQSAGLNSTSWQEASIHDALIIPYFHGKLAYSLLC